MSAQPAETSVVRPAFNRRKPVVDSDAYRQQDLEKVRFLFSPLLFVDTRYDLAGFDQIRPGEIHVVDVYRMKIANTKRIQEGTTSAEPELIWHSRLPGIIANVILRNNREDDGVPTGLCELEELRGLNPTDNPEHEELIADIQSTLWPVTYPTAREQLESLVSRRGEAFAAGEIYSKTLERMIQAVETATAYCDVSYVNLVDELSQRAAGGEGAKGRRNRVDNEDRRRCAYIEKDVPVIASPLVQNRVKEIQAAQTQAAQAPTLDQVQCANCGAMANRIVATGMPPKLCANCGNDFALETAAPQVAADLRCGDFGGDTKAGAPCKNVAGQGTDHIGKGRCEHHPE